LPNVLSQLLSLDEAIKEEQGIVHTPAEMARQPKVWDQTVETMKDPMELLAELIDKDETIILTGAGSSYYAAQCVEAALAGKHQGFVRSISSTDILMYPEGTLPRSRFILVSFARSGNSPEGNAVFKLAEALRPGLVKQVVITCNDKGELAQLARASTAPSVLCVLPPDTNDAGLAMTSSFTSMVVAGFALAHPGDFAGYEETIGALSKAAELFFEEHSETLKNLAYLPFERIFFIGASPFYGAALESHLKVQEMTDGKVVGKAEDTLGLRHGPMAAIDENTLVILFSSGDTYRRQYESDLLKELAAKNLGRRRIVIGPKPESGWAGLCHHILELDVAPQLHNSFLSILLVLPAQIIGLFKSLELGLMPDTPSRERVIHRVVQGVTIYPYSG
jgi:tagatose-6-phosphate ketose/aldose isomerase